MFKIPKDIWTLKEIAEEVDKLIRYTHEMKILTRYDGGEKVEIQKLSLWTYNILRKGE